MLRARLADVAARAGVANSTVSNYLHRPEVVALETQARIRDAIDELRYIPNDNARRLRSGRSRTIALMLLDAWIPFYAQVSRGVEDVAFAGGWTVLFSNTGRDPERERRNLDVFESNRVQGVLIVPQGDVRDRLRDLRRAGTACVMIEESGPPMDLPSVAVNDVTGGALAGKHLLGMGRRRLAFIGDPVQVRHVGERWQGFRETTAASSVPTPKVVATQTLTMQAGLLAAEPLLALPRDQWPDGVFAANDLVALGMLQAFLRRGVRVPDDVALVGFDDIEFAAQAAIPLTTVRQPAYRLGTAAAELLIDEMTGGGAQEPRHIVFEPQLVVRESAP